MGETARGGLSGLIATFGRRETYLRLTYLFGSVVLGPIYFVVLTIGLLTAAGLSLTVFGVPLGIALILATRYVAEFERVQARRLLGMDVEVPRDTRIDGDGLWAWTRIRLVASSTWKGIGFLYGRFGFGLLVTVVVVAPLALGLVFVAAPILYLATDVELALAGVGLSSLPATLAVVPVGVVLVVLAVTLGVFTTRLWEIAVRSLLDKSRR
jgi:hypothetical protein